MAKLNFPDPNDTQVYEAAGIKWTWNATMQVWSAEGPDGQYVEEAPNDGQQYGRQNEAWTVVQGAVEKAPDDGQQPPVKRSLDCCPRR